ncbi:MAG: hypothetical protein IPL59_18485 [Candidatus Competibacteraceae bacterium]|nr:hypothetical protein [Candidatus Competibacteraceae bacterium]
MVDQATGGLGGRESRAATTVARHCPQENLDTLENRVLKDFLRLSIEEGRIYLRANERYGNTERIRLVNRYLALCRRHHRELYDLGISNPAHPVTPNYVLQQDARYQVIWRLP